MSLDCTKVLSVKLELGESLIWDVRSSTLFMTDIMNGCLVEVDIKKNHTRKWKFNQPLAWVVPLSVPEKFLLGFESGIGVSDLRAADQIIWLENNFPRKNNCRLNDVCTDAFGRVWYGSMNMLDANKEDGELASFSSREGLRIHDSGFTVTNGPVISPDSEFLFFNDTLRGTIYRYRLFSQQGELIERTIFKQFSPEEGYPDGMCFDSAGNLWVALWGGSCVVQLSPEGKLIKKISIPALNVTNVCFCGEKLNRLLVSSAYIGLTEQQMLEYPDSGAIFEINGHMSVGVKTYPAVIDE